jgi:hypothetical protein
MGVNSLSIKKKRLFKERSLLGELSARLGLVIGSGWDQWWGL